MYTVTRPTCFCFVLSMIILSNCIKNEEVIKLKKQLSDTIKVHEDAKIDRANTINRLAKSLEESQRQCSDLLEAGVKSIIGNCNF